MNLKNLMWSSLIFVVSACGAADEVGPADRGGMSSGDAALGAVCLGIPSCDAGHFEVKGPTHCLQDDAECYERSLCGKTIWCTGPSEPIECLAYPSCDAGHVEVKGPTDCLQDDAECYERSLCGDTIWCTGPSDPVACREIPTCDKGDFEVKGPSHCLQDDAACYERTECDTTIWCTGPRPHNPTW